jgi:predicted patatin/cPLA2 family phospholipase
MKKVGMVLEGGAMRGMYTAGVLDVMMNENINVDEIFGVSAGALFGVNYFSKQKGRVIRYSKKYAKDLRYISVSSFLLTGNLVNKNFAYYRLTKELDPFDNETFMNSKKKFYAVATNIKTGTPEYLPITDCINDLEILRATSAIPLVTKPVVINSNKYLDGAVSDSIPIKKALTMGYDKIIVVLTRPDTYQKEELSDSSIKRINKKYKKYPKLISAMLKRPKMYNETTKYIKELENEGKIFVIRPSEPININVIERNKNNLQKVYDLGVKDANKKIKSLKEYLDT